MAQELTLNTFAADLLPRSAGGTLQPGQVQGVFFTIHEDITEIILAKVARWFAGRPEISYVDHGTTDKQQDGYIILEWNGYQVDPLFLAILRDDETVLDYTLYTRFANNEGRV